LFKIDSTDSSKHDHRPISYGFNCHTFTTMHVGLVILRGRQNGGPDMKNPQCEPQLTFRLPSYFIVKTATKGGGGYHPLDLVLGSRYCIV